MVRLGLETGCEECNLVGIPRLRFVVDYWEGYFCKYTKSSENFECAPIFDGFWYPVLCEEWKRLMEVETLEREGSARPYLNLCSQVCQENRYT